MILPLNLAFAMGFASVVLCSSGGYALWHAGLSIAIDLRAGRVPPLAAALVFGLVGLLFLLTGLTLWPHGSA